MVCRPERRIMTVYLRRGNMEGEPGVDRTEAQAVETAGGDSRDRVFSRSDPDALTNGILPRKHHAFPEAITDDHGRVGVALAVLVVAEEPARVRLRAQHVEERRRYL